LGYLARRTIAGASQRVGGFLLFLKYWSDKRSRFDNGRVDSLRGEFVTVGFGKGFERELAGAVQGKTGNHNAASAAAALASESELRAKAYEQARAEHRKDLRQRDKYR